MNYRSSRIHLSYFSVFITFICVILLQYGLNIKIELSRAYGDGIIPSETIVTFIAALAILMYFDSVKKSYIFFAGLNLMALTGIKLVQWVLLINNSNSGNILLNQSFLGTKSSLLNLLTIAGFIYFIYINKKNINITYVKMGGISICSFFIGIFLYYLDEVVFYTYLSGLSTYWKMFVTMVNMLSMLVLIVLFIKKEQESKETVIIFLIMAELLQFFNQVYTFCDLANNTALIYFADIFYVLSMLIILFGVCISLKVKYNGIANIIEESAELKEDMLKYYKILQETPNYVFVLNKKGEVYYSNNSVNNFVKENYGIHELKGKNIDDIITRKKKTYDLTKLNKVIDIDKQVSAESKIIGKNQKVFHFSTYISELEIDGELFFLGVMNDNTDYVNMSNKLQKSEKKFRQITDSVHDLICKIDIEGRIDYCSPSYTNLFGGNYGDYKGVPWVHNVVENDIDKVLKDISLCLEENKIVTNECKMKSNRNTYIYVNYVVNPVAEKGEIDGAIISARNITYKKLAEKELKESERKYSEIFNMCPDMIYVLDSKSLRIIDVNPAMSELLGRSKESILNKYLKQVFDDIDYESEINIIKYLNEGLIVRGHEISFSFYGEPRYLEVNYSPLIEDGQLSKIICLARDITEKKKIVQLKEEHEKDRKKLDEALQYDQLKTEFFANISHELRTPINVIFSVIQVLDLYRDRQNIINMPYDKYSNVLRQNCYRLLRLINNLIDITKIDAGYLKLNYGVYDIIKIVEDITISVVTYAENKGIEVIFDTYIEELYTYCDPDKIERIVLNLLSNAIKFTDENGKIMVLMNKINDNVIISVKDTGRGIPNDQIDVIFERFRQVDKSLAREHEGSGIGLSLVKSLAELHGGTVNAKSVLNEGSEFVISIPIIEASAAENPPIVMVNEDNRIERINIEFSDIYEIC